jgi:glycine cleavage system pyridoxal-binding protein P
MSGDDPHLFASRHLGPTDAEASAMAAALGYESVDALIDATVPSAIRTGRDLEIGEAKTETEALAELAAIFAGISTNTKPLIGMGYYGTHHAAGDFAQHYGKPRLVHPIHPYQAEIAQGRLEALLNFQTMVSDLTGMDIANASLLDEGTAAAEAMTLCKRAQKRGGRQHLFRLRKVPPADHRRRCAPAPIPSGSGCVGGRSHLSLRADPPPRSSAHCSNTPIPRGRSTTTGPSARRSTPWMRWSSSPPICWR